MAEDGGALRARAEQCRRLARGVGTGELRHALRAIAEEYETRVAAAEADAAPPPPSGPAS